MEQRLILWTDNHATRMNSIENISQTNEASRRKCPRNNRQVETKECNFDGHSLRQYARGKILGSATAINEKRKRMELRREEAFKEMKP